VDKQIGLIDLLREKVALFDREILRKRSGILAQNFAQANFLHHEIARITWEKVRDLDQIFDSTLEISAKDKILGQEILNKGQTKNLLQSEINNEFKPDVICDDENLPFSNNSFDLILSNLNLHFINNLPENLCQIHSLRRQNGVFIASFFGEENLKELRQAVIVAEEEVCGGISPRMAPNIDVKSAGRLLAEAGFSNPVAEKLTFEVEYSSVEKLLRDLKNMGAGNILTARSKKMARRQFLINLTNHYQNLFSRASFGGGKYYLATFEIIIVTGWKK